MPPKHTDCRARLRASRKDARRCHARTPRLVAKRLRPPVDWIVYANGDPDRVLWFGFACCAWDARRMALLRAIAAAIWTQAVEATS